MPPQTDRGEAQAPVVPREVFLTAALQRLKSLCGASRRYAAVRESCAHCLSELAAAEKPAPSASPAAAGEQLQRRVSGGTASHKLTSLCFVPLKFACESQSLRMVECALDCMQKLMAYGFVAKETRWIPPEVKGAQWAQTAQTWGRQSEDKRAEREARMLVWHIVQTVCDVVSSDMEAVVQSAVVQLQALKALLHSVTTASVGVHGNTLLQAVRGVYNIFLTSPSPVNQAAAKGALNQMVGVVMQRMEAAGTAATAAKPHRVYSSMRAKQPSVTLSPGSMPSPTTPPTDLLAAALPSPAAAAAQCSSEGVSIASEAECAHEWVRDLVLRVVDTAAGATLSANTSPQRTPRAGAAAAAADEVNDQATSTACGTPRAETQQTDFDFARAAVQRQQQHAVASLQADGKHQHVAASRSAGEVTQTLTSAAGGRGSRMQDQLQRDAYHIFRSFCKLSARPASAANDSVERKSKLLSLELIHNVLSQSGEVFRSSERFLQEVKESLCMSLLENCLSTVPTVFRMALEIFLDLATSLKDQLKAEVGVFFTNVFFVLLDSPNATAGQKVMIVQALQKVAQNPQTLTDIFVNYDCDIDSFNIFETLVNTLSRIAQSRQARATQDDISDEESKLRFHALKALTCVAQSMVAWVEKFHSEAEAESSVDPAREDSVTDSREPELDVGTPRSGAPGAPGSGIQDDDEFDRCRARKKELESILVAFNRDAKKGLERVFEAGVLEREPCATAAWLRNTAGIDKRMIGEYLARTKDFERAVLDAYVETFDFEGMEIDEAVRKFLSTFKICGEAQVIDRTMEKFAEQYSKGNEKHFANADTVFALSFSIIMLNTDSHSVHIKDKMTKAEFLKNNRGLDDGKDLPAATLSAIYDRVCAQPFELETSGGQRRGNDGARARGGWGVVDNLAALPDAILGDGRKRAHNYEQEMRDTLRRATQTFNTAKEKAGSDGELFFIANKRQHVRPMFEAVWGAMLSALSVQLEQSGDLEVVDLCIEGLRCCIHTACAFVMDTPRDAFVTAVSKLTFLSNTREIEERNIKSVRLLIDIAKREGNMLRSSWLAVLKCASQLERLQLHVGDKRAEEPDRAKPARTSFLYGRSAADKARDSRRANAEVMRHNETVNALLIAETIEETSIARVYSSTADMSDEAVMYFVRALCEVSTEEIEQADPPRMYSLQKLIEVADANMDRMRVVWTQLWKHMSAHFIRVGENPSLRVSMFGVDSLRQLATKFLAKPELTNYHFQRDFLKPFETIVQHSEAVETRELVVQCVAQMVHASAHHIKSGWKVIFAVFACAASDSSERIVESAFAAADATAERYLPWVVAADAFTDAVNSFIAFGCNRLLYDTAINAIGHFEGLADALVNGVLDASGTQRYVDRALGAGELVSTEDKTQLRGWLAILSGLCSAAAQHPHGDVRLAAEGTLFNVLRRHGDRLSAGMWQLVLSVSIVPIFDSAFAGLAATGDPTPDRPPVPQLIMERGLSSLVCLFGSFFPRLRGLLSDFVDLITHCVVKARSAPVASFGIAALGQLLRRHCGKPLPDSDADPASICFDASEWALVAQKVGVLTDTLFPSGLIGCRWDGVTLAAVPAEASGGGTPPVTPASQLGTRHMAAVWARQLRLLCALVSELHRCLVEVCGLAPAEPILAILGSMRRVDTAADTAMARRCCAEALERVSVIPVADGDVSILVGLLDCESASLRAGLLSLAAALRDPPRDSPDDFIKQASEHLCIVAESVFARLQAAEGSPGRLHRVLAAAALTVHILVDVHRDGVAGSDHVLERFAPSVLGLVTAGDGAVREAARRFFAEVCRARMSLSSVEVGDAPAAVMSLSPPAPRPGSDTPVATPPERSGAERGGAEGGHRDPSPAPQSDKPAAPSPKPRKR